MAEAVDSRADIWAFGVVLYELVTGRRLFDAENVSETLAAVLREDPTWDTLPASAPPGVRRLLRRCLQRDRRNRLQHAGDARVEIQDALTAPTADIADHTAPPARWRERGAWAVAGVALFVAVGLTYFPAGQPASEPVRELSVVPPSGWTFSLVDAPVLSPDGARLAFVGVDANGNTQLWIRDLDDVEPRPIVDTEDGRSPFWSPDGLSLAFFANRGLRRIDLAGGPVRTLAAVDVVRGGTWSSDGTIVFSQGNAEPLLRVTEDGGTPTPVTQMDTDGELSHRFPSFLPDGRRFLFVIQSLIHENSGLYVGSLDSDERTRIGDIRSRAIYAESGRLLFTRNRTLMAQPFDPVALELSGDATVVGGRVASAINLFGQATFSVSEGGVLAYRRVPLLQFAWFDRSGQRLGSLGAPGEYSSLDLSPDGQYVVYEQLDPEMHTGDIWMLDVVRGTPTRLTTDPGWDWMPTWSPDGRAIIFGRDGRIYRIAPDGDESEELFDVGRVGTEAALSGDGRYLVYAAGQDLWAWPVSGDAEPIRVVDRDGEEVNPRVSPDGRWVAYQSNQSGSAEVYIELFPQGGGRVPVSAGGGTQPLWRGDGRELYYVDPGGRLMAASLSGAEQPEVASTQVLADAKIISTSNRRFHFSPTADGERFLVTTVEDGESASITVVLNWTSQLGDGGLE